MPRDIKSSIRINQEQLFSILTKSSQDEPSKTSLQTTEQSRYYEFRFVLQQSNSCWEV